jgi:PBP1b-binding outer membrane lipoprotein LpoB
MKNVRFVLIAMTVGLFGCVASTNRVDVASDEPFSDTETSSKDLVTVAQNMARSLIQLPQISNSTCLGAGKYGFPTCAASL